MRVNEEHVTHPDQAFRFLRLELPAFGGARHRHAQIELTWIERGAGLRFVGDSSAPFEDGDLVLLGPQVPHLWASGAAARARAPLLASVVQFPATLLQQALLPELAALRPLMARADRGLAIGGACHGAVTAHLRRMPGADALTRLAALVEILGALALHADTLQPIASTPLRSSGDAAARRIDRVTDWVHRHLGQPLTVAEAARLAHVTPAAFSRFFRRETGKTWSSYVNDVRCSQACVALRQSSRPVATIAQECGYGTLSHFNREFAARFGMAPRTYRNC